MNRNLLTLVLTVGLTGCLGPDQLPADDGDDTGPAVETDGVDTDLGTDTDDTDVVDTDTGPITPPWMVFQCDGLTGGVCIMRADGTRRTTVTEDGRAPDANAAGVVLFHDEVYHVIKRDSAGTETDLGEGSFARWAPDGRILFQCNGFNGGVCLMNADGTGREALETLGRVPDGGPNGIVYHSDGYKVVVRPPDGEEETLSDGAHVRWRPDGSLLFQCSGLNGGICTMAADGTGRQNFRAKGRNPDIGPGGWLVWHTDAYKVVTRAPDGTEREVGDGAMASFESP